MTTTDHHKETTMYGCSLDTVVTETQWKQSQRMTHSRHADLALAAIDAVLEPAPVQPLDYDFDLPAPRPSQQLSALGHPGYSDAFAGHVLGFVAHGMQPHAAIQVTYEYWGG